MKSQFIHQDQDSNNIASLLKRRRYVIEKSGPWINHAMALPYELWTEPTDRRSRRSGWDDVLLRRVVQTISDLRGVELELNSQKPFEGLRILDLGALEGLYSVEMALRGAETVALEVRPEHRLKIEFVKNELNLSNLTICSDDVRELSIEKHGEYDFVLCLGLLYHLPGLHALEVLSRIHQITRKGLILDTHITLSPNSSFTLDGTKYEGCIFKEHDPKDDSFVKQGRLTASIDNTDSFWFSVASLESAVLKSGFTSIYEILYPPPRIENGEDRKTFIALNNAPVTLFANPESQLLPPIPNKEDVMSWRTIINASKKRVQADGGIFKSIRNIARKIGVTFLGRLSMRTRNKRDSNFDKYKLHGAYHWPMLANDSTYRMRISLLMEFVNEKSQVLDLGCGDGAYIEVLSPEIKKIIGIDADERGTNLAKKLLKEKKRNNVEIHTATFTQILQQIKEQPEKSPLSKNTFDVIYSMDCIEHLREPESLLHLAQECVKPNGIVIIGTPEYVSDKEISSYHEHEFTEKELTDLIRQYFEIDEVRRLPANLRQGGIQNNRYLVIISHAKSPTGEPT